MDNFRQERKSVSYLVEQTKIPKMFKVKQVFSKDKIPREKVSEYVKKILEKQEILCKIRPNMKIAITASSRGIANADIIMKAIVDFVKNKQAYPFIVPAMGSHGGATAEGQKRILENYGITEETMGCPIYSSMQTVKIGTNEEGIDVYIDKYAANADGIILNCRVKPHTLFRGKYESGIMKMMAIGLGKQYGAEICHSAGVENLAKNVFLFGKCILKNAPILFAIATIDNAFEQTYKIEAIPAEKIEEEEPKILKQAFKQMGKILVDSCDILVVDKIGKNYSGDGMDPNVTGTFATKCATGGIKAQKVAVLDISEQSHGNGLGIGYADVTTQKLVDKLDLTSMYLNAITSTVLKGVSIPIIMKNDKEAIQVCIKSCTNVDKNNLKIVRIHNSLELEEIWLSEAYWEEIKSNNNIVVKSIPKELKFTEEGNLI